MPDSIPATEPPPARLPRLVRLSPDVMARQLDDETVLLDLESQRYFGLDAMGTRIWKLLEDDPSVSRVRGTLLAEFDVTAERVDHDLARLMTELEEAGLIVTSDIEG